MARSNAPLAATAPHLARVVGSIRPARSWRSGFERASRLGLVIRGIIYFVPGVFALEWALGRSHRSMTQSGTIVLIGQQPLGRVMLAIIAVGLAGYAVWGGVRAFADPLHRGHSPGGLALRAGYATSGLAYLGLLYGTLRLMTGGAAGCAAAPDWMGTLLAHPFGRTAIVIVGLCWIFGSGITQIVTGWRRGFERDLEMGPMGRRERRWAVGLGRVGLMARGFVFTLTGILIVADALHLHPSSSTGLDGALLELAHQPFGRALLGAAGAGLMVFGLYSAMCARWMRMHRLADDPGSPALRTPLRETNRT